MGFRWNSRGDRDGWCIACDERREDANVRSSARRGANSLGCNIVVWTESGVTPMPNRRGLRKVITVESPQLFPPVLAESHVPLIYLASRDNGQLVCCRFSYEFGSSIFHLFVT
jgi:hypothetical protein